jgi:hypothetical protein
MVRFSVVRFSNGPLWDETSCSVDTDSHKLKQLKVKIVIIICQTSNQSDVNIWEGWSFKIRWNARRHFRLFSIRFQIRSVFFFINCDLFIELLLTDLCLREGLIPLQLENRLWTVASINISCSTVSDCAPFIVVPFLFDIERN